MEQGLSWDELPLDVHRYGWETQRDISGTKLWRLDAISRQLVLADFQNLRLVNPVLGDSYLERGDTAGWRRN
jgi:hypothetical protein